MNCIEELVLPFFRSMGLDAYLLDPDVSELMITNGLVFVEEAGKIREVGGIRIDERKLRAGVEIIGQSIGDQIDEYQKPWLDSRLPDGSRVAATYPPISPQGVTVTIRKFLRHFTTDELVERRALTPEALDLIVAAVHARKNILVSGGTSTGKTTLTNAFVRHIPAHERIVVIEKPVEMKLDHRNSPRFEAYPKVGDRPEVTVSQLLSLTLRHRPDRIIVGEVKDSEAAYGLLQAMNTGHDGTFSTIHANTALSALNRLASLAMPGFGSLDLSRQETAAAIDLVIEVKRNADGWRGVNCVLGVGDYDDRSRKFETKEVYRRAAA
ncbi:MAG TPA: ATPase, T2SS/T4P/T4SS family [Bryobacteraceae bacterium]|jgi:pilus assembly protein CpaF|nr:ATPase, T2SS/T4P/T4SS family [Bryobacteraceae bacterium]